MEFVSIVGTVLFLGMVALALVAVADILFSHNRGAGENNGRNGRPMLLLFIALLSGSSSRRISAFIAKRDAHRQHSRQSK